jgi:hypothetical protein
VGRPSLLVIVYLVIGVIVAVLRDYFQDIDGIKGVVSAALAIVLWPLVLFDVNVRIGKLDDDKGRNGLLLAAWVATMFGRSRRAS